MYVDEKFYLDEFKGEPVDSTDFPILESRAAEIIEELTMYRVNEVSMTNLPTNTIKAVKKAVCAQIEYLDANGGIDIDSGNAIQSGSVGKFSFTKGGNNTGEVQSIYSPRAKRILYPTGLLYRGRL